MPWQREAHRGAAAALCAAVILALAGCTPVPLESPSPESSSQATDLPVAAVTAPPSASGDDAPAPQISVQITTEPPKPADDGGSGTSVRVESSVSQSSADYASKLVSLANGARADAGLGKLSRNSCAAKAARARAARALAKSHLEHEALPDCGTGWAGENLARHHGSPKDMHDAWMASPGHRENILRPEFTGIGVGCVAYSRKDPQRPATSADDVGGHVCSEVFVG